MNRAINGNLYHLLDFSAVFAIINPDRNANTSSGSRMHPAERKLTPLRPVNLIRSVPSEGKMHIWDTFRIALHPDGCNAILLFLGQTLEAPCQRTADHSPQFCASKGLKYTKYFLVFVA